MINRVAPTPISGQMGPQIYNQSEECPCTVYRMAQRGPLVSGCPASGLKVYLYSVALAVDPAPVYSVDEAVVSVDVPKPLTGYQ